MVFWSKWSLLAELVVSSRLFTVNVFKICLRPVMLCKYKNHVHVVCIVYCSCFCSLWFCIDISVVFVPSTEMEPLKTFCFKAVCMSVCTCSCTKSLWTRYLTDHRKEFHYIYILSALQTKWAAYCKTRFFRVPFISRISRAWQVRENNGPRKFEYSSVSV